MMWKVFIAELKATFSSKRMIIKWCAVLLIPFIYAFTYLFAFWNPYQYLPNLKLTVVNNDVAYNNLNVGQSLEDAITSKNIKIQGYELHFTSSKSHSNINDLLKDYYGIVEIPAKYTETTVKTITDIIKNHNSKSFINLPQINFHNSYKDNFLIGEVTSFASSMSPVYIVGVEAVIDSVHQAVNSYINTNFPKTASGLIIVSDQMFLTFQNSLNELKAHPLFKLESQAEFLNSYGFGLAPYFICIGLWVGQLVQHFLVNKKRRLKRAKTLPNFFGKTLFLMMNATIQAALLLVSLSAIGLRLSGWNEFYLIIFVVFLGWLFTLMIQALIFMFKKPDIGRFLIIILLVLQLSSSSGTFPAVLQPKVFQGLHQIIPFTYTIKILREIFFEPRIWVVVISLVILLSYLLWIVPWSLYLNYRSDKRALVANNNNDDVEIILE